MGYSTDFFGSFKINEPVDEGTEKLLDGIWNTRRMKRNIKGYGTDGEFYVGDDREDTIIDYNRPPGKQPGLWCQWQLQGDKQSIAWDGGEKFYAYTEWITYIIDSILAPRGYIVNGEVEWSGEDPTDVGKIVVKNNKVKELVGRVVYD